MEELCGINRVISQDVNTREDYLGLEDLSTQASIKNSLMNSWNDFKEFLVKM